MGITNRELNLYIDMDGVICNFVRSAIDAHVDVSPVGDMLPSQVEEWDFFEQYGLDREAFLRPIKQWEGFWRFIPAYSFADEFLFRVGEIVRESSLDIRVHFCSSPIDCPDCYSGKLSWLQNHGFLEYSEGLILVKDKTTLIRSDAILIDDRQDTIDQWRREGGLCVLYPRQWNRAGLSLVEGDLDSELEGVQAAIDGLRHAIGIREREIDLMETRHPMYDHDRGDDMSQPTGADPGPLSDLEDVLPLSGAEEILPDADAGPQFFNIEIGEGDTLDSILDFLGSSDGDDLSGVEAEFCDCEDGCEKCLTPEALQDTAETIEEALDIITPDDGEVRSVSSSGGEKGTKLARFDLIPIEPLTELAKHFGRGSLKYDDHNYRKGYEWSKSYAACLRHLTQFWNGEDLDEETGTPHVISAAWHCLALYEFMLHHPDFDDRYTHGE